MALRLQACGAVTGSSSGCRYGTEPRRRHGSEDERLMLSVVPEPAKLRNARGRWAIALQSFDFALIAEHLGEQAESAMTDEMTVIVGDDAGTFLTAMLQRAGQNR